MSDEEKEAIEYLKRHIIPVYGKKGQIEYFLNDIVLNLIEKQSKEIEELNLENIELKQSKIVDKNSIPNQDNFYDCYNFIHNDKIKAKIEVLEKLQKEFPNNDEIRIKIIAYKELLEKE